LSIIWNSLKPMYVEYSPIAEAASPHYSRFGFNTMAEASNVYELCDVEL